MKLTHQSDGRLILPDQHIIQDDFDHYVTADEWTTIATDSGTVSVADGVGGQVDIDSNSTDNDQTYMHQTTESFLFADGKPLEFITRLRLNEAGANVAAHVAGLMNAWAADHIADGGILLVASYSGALFFKKKGGTKWTFNTSIGTTEEETLLSHLAPDSASAFQTLKIVARSIDATHIEVIPYIDLAGGYDFKQCTRDLDGALVKHTLTLGSPTEMAVGYGVKAGSAAAENLFVDYVHCSQKR